MCTAAISQELTTITAGVFDRFSEHVVKAEVIEAGSGAKATIGSGFFAGAGGHVITNYHVISKLIHDPDRYLVKVMDAKRNTWPARVLAIDAVYDLAILRIEHHPDKYFSLQPVKLSQGTRLYSLGHPLDLGLSIVEGTYNGLLEHTLYPRIHFTGSINPGMSGGPTITERGQLVGVNVSTAGNQLSFLVPIKRAAALLAETLKRNPPANSNFLAELGRQIDSHQAIYLENLFVPSTPTVALGNYALPTKPAPFFKCWADATRRTELPYEVLEHQCSTDDYVYISADQSSGIVQFLHQLISSDTLNPLRFSALYSTYFQAGSAWVYGVEGEVTPFRCDTQNVKSRGLKFKAVLCVRRYVKLPGLYDAVFKAAVLGAHKTGLITTLTLSGVSFENAQLMGSRYLERVTWSK